MKGSGGTAESVVTHNKDSFRRRIAENRFVFHHWSLNLDGYLSFVGGRKGRAGGGGVVYDENLKLVAEGGNSEYRLTRARRGVNGLFTRASITAHAHNVPKQ